MFEKAPRTREARRLWVQDQAAAMCVPGWATPRWRQLYAKPTPYVDEQTCDECGAHLDGEHAPECSRFDAF